MSQHVVFLSLMLETSYWSCSKLVITQIIPEDDAIYQCAAENEQGAVLSLARLIVVMSEDRPSAPRNVHAETISSAAILLAWERPLYNANKVIAYSIHYMKAEGETHGRRAKKTETRCVSVPSLKVYSCYFRLSEVRVRGEDASTMWNVSAG